MNLVQVALIKPHIATSASRAVALGAEEQRTYHYMSSTLSTCHWLTADLP